MNKKIMLMAVVGALLLASCQVTQKSVSATEIQGEWDIVEINGTSVSEKSFPFIGFDTQEGRIYGNSGCNRIMGNFDLSSKSNKVELGQMTSTMMACPNIELERNVLDALVSVTRIKQAGKNKIALYQSGEKLAMLLQRRFKVVPLADLQGEWRIIKIFNEALPVGIKTVPNLIFDISNRKINGHAGCNQFMGGFQTKDGIKNSISFTGVGTTRMACPDMQIENNLLAALNNIKTFGLLGNGNLVLYTGDGNQAIELMRHR